MVASPDPTSISGFALRVRAILAPATITPKTATAAAIGSIHCWRLFTAGSAARSGDGSLTHQLTLLAVTQATPEEMALAIELSASLATVPATAFTADAGQAADRAGRVEKRHRA